MPNEGSGFGLYVHWPYCLSKCPYCDFNSHVRASIDAAAWTDALCRELGAIAARLDARPRLDTIFFGGGTPSLMPGKAVARIIAEAARLFGLSSDIEITLEANPTSVEAERFRDYRIAGVNRISLGVQALNDEDLRFLGRLHTCEEALRAVALGQAAFPRVSFDLIYARPRQTAAAWQAELESALAQGCSHYSLYQLTFEPGTPFHAAQARGSIVPLDAERSSELYELTQRLTGVAGVPAYEVSNHARPGEESRHNLIYWRYGDYVGVGPGAHGRLTVEGRRVATAIERDPERWLKLVGEEGHGVRQWEALSPEQAGIEALLMGMRLSEGIDRSEIESRMGRSLSDARIEALAGHELITSAGGRMAATPRGRLVLNAVLRELLAA